MTTTKLLEKAKKIREKYPPPEPAIVEKEFPDGWKIVSVINVAEAIYEGTLMGNCINPYDGACGWILDKEDEYFDINPEDLDNMGRLPSNPPIKDLGASIPYEVYSLRDPFDIPRSTYVTQTQQLLGRHNDTVKPEQVEYWEDFLSREEITEMFRNDPEFKLPGWKLNQETWEAEYETV